MNYTTLIAAEQLQPLIESGQPLRIFDCSFDLMAPHAGRQHYLDRTDLARSTPIWKPL